MIRLGKEAQKYADSVIDDIRKGKYSFEWYENNFWDHDYSDSYLGEDYSLPDPNVLDYIREKLLRGQESRAAMKVVRNEKSD